MTETQADEEFDEDVPDSVTSTAAEEEAQPRASNKVSALRSEFQENWRKILLPEALSCISHSFGIFSFVSVGRELQA